jgi:hypothetical protein
MRAVDIALKTPGISSAVNIVGFSGATFTLAPNAGAVFVVLEPFEERARDRARIRTRIIGELYKSWRRSRRRRSSWCARRRCRASAMPAVSA